MAAPNNNATAQLSADEIDDILYLTRTNDSAELLPYLSQLAQQHNAESGASILASCVDGDSGNTAFHYAAANGSTELLTSLLTLFPSTPTSLASKKQLLNAKNASGNTPVHWAALNGHASTVELLTSSGADVWVKNAAGNLPVFEAERADKGDVVAVLLLAGGKEVEEGLKDKEGGVSAEDEDDVRDGGVGSSGTADEAAEKLERMNV